MASIQNSSSDVELLQPEVSKPSPLRIIKRSQTITGSSSSRETFGRGRQSSSCSSLQSKGSPPMGADRPLTVRKKRQGGGAFVSLSSEDRSWDKENERPFPAMSGANEEDPDITPKARQRVSRTISAGNFLKHEFHQRSLELEEGRYSVRNRNHPTPFYSTQVAQHLTASPRFGKVKPSTSPPKIPERRPSKSKNFILRALAGRGSADSSHTRRVSSKSSRNTLVRRVSRTSTMDSGRSRRISMSGETLYSIEMQDDNLDVPGSQLVSPDRGLLRDPAIRPGLFPSQEPAPQQGSLVLSPRIKVTPEITSLQTTTSIFWVAIEILGELHAADVRYDMHPSLRRCSSQLADVQSQDLSQYGKMYAMAYTLQPPEGCTILDRIDFGDEAFNLGPCETRLILAQIRVDGVDSNPSPPTRDPEILMAELENHLGDTLTHYLTIRLQYKHYGFTRWESNYAPSEGMYVHSSFHETEARVAIKRHDPLSAWSPRTSETITTPPPSNVFNDLIAKHLPAHQAAEAYSVISRSQQSTPLINNRLRTRPMYSLFPRSSNLSNTTPRHAVRSVDEPIVVPPPRHVRRAQGIDDEYDPASDPATGIWANIREVSTGGRPRHQRQSISADHYTILDNNAHGPSRISSSQSLDDVLQNPMFDSPSEVARERTKLKGIALKNKRSVGTETLRSMAPSVAKHGKERGGENDKENGKGKQGGWWGNFFGN